MRRDYAKHRDVAEVFYRHAREAVHESGLPVLEVTDAQQRGDGFGPRFANALADAFAAGYEHVIAVGSDCPRLHEVDWGQVAGRLSAGTPVLGPTSGREGTYLIGLSRKHFDRAAFEALPWRTSVLFDALAGYLEQRSGGAPAVLAVRDDVNDHGDLLAHLHGRSVLPTALRRRLRRVLGERKGRGRTRPPASTHRNLRRRSRAPPALGAGPSEVGAPPCPDGT